MNTKENTLVMFPASKNYPVDPIIDPEFKEEVTDRFCLVEKRLEQVRKELELIDKTQDKIKFYLDEIDNFIP